MRAGLAAAALLGVTLTAGVARGQGAPPGPTEEQIEAAVKADAHPAPPATAAAAPSAADAADAEAPPPIPRKNGVVVESRLGALAFLGRFRQVAPTAPWFQIDAGYELFRWLLLFGEGELAITDTS